MERTERPPHPWERALRQPRHPVGKPRRRWPLVEAQAIQPDGAVQPRYRRISDRREREKTRRTTAPRSTFDALRQNPVRNGLIGLAMVGSAAPLAVNRYQQALRTDPSHEASLAHGITGAEGNTDADVTQEWQELEAAEAEAVSEREAALRENLDRYAEFGLDRGLAENIYDTATENHIDPEVAFGLVRAESAFKNSSTSPVGAVGLTQLMPRTAAWLQPGVTPGQLRDPQTNLRIGFKYLRQLMDKYEGDEKLALLAYNRGPGTVDRALRQGKNPDNGYADFVHGKAGHSHRLYTAR